MGNEAKSLSMQAWFSRVSYIIGVIVKLIRDDTEIGEFQTSWQLLGLVVAVSSMPHKLMQPGGREKRDKVSPKQLCS